MSITHQDRDNFNIAYKALDQHAQNQPDKTALICITQDLQEQKYSYAYLKDHSNKLANLLVSLGIQKNDRVFVYLPRIIESVVSFLGILKTGGIAGTLFSAFEEKALLDRLHDSGVKVIITNTELLGRIQKIRMQLPTLEKIIVVGAKDQSDLQILPFNESEKHSTQFTIPLTDKDDNAFMLYTSGSTGKPKGILHAHRAIIQQHSTFQHVFAPTNNTIYWCTADLGWITGVSYVLLGPLSHGITTILYEGRFSPHNWFTILDRYKVSRFYTAPTAIRMLMAANLDPTQYNFNNLEIIASVGEPLNPEAIVWGQKFFKKTIYDTWFQTELGSICITNRPGQTVKIGSVGTPLPGIEAAIVDEQGKEVPIGTVGNLVLKPNLSSMMKTVWNNEEKYNKYFKHGYYYSGDLAYQDKDGYIFFNGRSDDVINTQGERIGPFEIESALLVHPLVIEAAVIGKPDELRGEIIKAFVVLSTTQENLETLKTELIHFVKEQMGGPFYPREIEFIEKLPKTRSGKIMRRILKAKELGQDPGDLSSLDED